MFRHANISAIQCSYNILYAIKRCVETESQGPKFESAPKFCTGTAWIVEFLQLYPKFQGSNFLLGLYRPVCVRPGLKPRRPIFSHRRSYNSF